MKTRTIPTFTDFRDGIGGQIISRVLPDILKYGTWNIYAEELRELVFDGLDAAVADAGRNVSDDERTVLAAALSAAGLSGHADGLYDDQLVEPWGALTKVDGIYRDAVLACIARIDG